MRLEKLDENRLEGLELYRICFVALIECSWPLLAMVSYGMAVKYFVG